MAGEFDPLGGDLYSIMGGIPGGGPVGAMAAGQMQQANLQQKQAEAELQRQQAAFQQAQAQRTQQLTQPEVQQTLGLAGLYGAQIGRMGAETGKLWQDYAARAANFPGEIKTTGQELGAKGAGADRQKYDAIASMSFPYLNIPQGLPPDMKENYLDTFGKSSQLDTLPNWKQLKEQMMNGGITNGQQALGMYYALSPKIAEEETAGQFQLATEEKRAQAQRDVASITAQSRIAVQSSRAQVQQLTAGKTPDAQLSMLQNLLVSEQDPAKREALQQEIEFTVQRVNQVNAVKSALANMNMNKAAIDGVIAKMLDQGQGGQVNAPQSPVPQLPNPSLPNPTGPQLGNPQAPQTNIDPQEVIKAFGNYDPNYEYARINGQLARRPRMGAGAPTAPNQ